MVLIYASRNIRRDAGLKQYQNQSQSEKFTLCKIFQATSLKYHHVQEQADRGSVPMTQHTIVSSPHNLTQD